MYTESLISIQGEQRNSAALRTTSWWNFRGKEPPREAPGSTTPGAPANVQTAAEIPRSWTSESEQCKKSETVLQNMYTERRFPKEVVVQFLSRVWFCDPMDGSTPGFPVLQHLPEPTQTHVHWVGDAMQPSHPLPSPSLLALSLSQHQGLFKWVTFLSHHVAKGS